MIYLNAIWIIFSQHRNVLQTKYKILQNMSILEQLLHAYIISPLPPADKACHLISDQQPLPDLLSFKWTSRSLGSCSHLLLNVPLPLSKSYNQVLDFIVYFVKASTWYLAHTSKTLNKSSSLLPQHQLFVICHCLWHE